MNLLFDFTWLSSLVAVVLGIAAILGWFIKTVIFDRWEAKQS